MFILETTTASRSSPVFLVVMLVLLGGMLVYSMFSGKKQRQKEATMRNNLQVGDEITTIGGIIGKITSIKGETITIETSKDRTKIRFLRTAVRSVDVKAEESGATVKLNGQEVKAETKTEENTEEN